MSNFWLVSFLIQLFKTENLDFLFVVDDLKKVAMVMTTKVLKLVISFFRKSVTF